MEAGDLHEDIAVLAFVAGRTDWANNGAILVPMSPIVHRRFLEFLTQPIEE